MVISCFFLGGAVERLLETRVFLDLSEFQLGQVGFCHARSGDGGLTL